MGRRYWITGLLPALAAGLAARSWYFSDLRLSAVFDVPIVDSLTYQRLAETLLAGADGVFFRPPLYPLFLAVIRLLAGEGQAAIVWAQFALGLAAVVPVYFLALRWRGPSAASLTAWIVALYPLRIFYEGEILAVTLFGFLLALALWMLWCRPDERRIGRFFSGGLVFGLAVLTRPNVLLAVPFLLLPLLFDRRGGGGRLPVLAAWVAGVVLAVLPATLHNYRAEGELIPVAANGGINFYYGNGPEATGETPLPPGLQWQDAVQAPLREGRLSLSSQDDYWWALAGDYIGGDIPRWLGLLGRKALFFWNARESGNNKDLSYFTGLSPVTRYYRWWFGTLLCLAMGAIGAAPRAAGTRRIISLLSGYWLAVALFFVTARYRLPLIPFLAIPAAALLAGLPALLRDRHRSAVSAAAAMAVTAAMVFPPWFGFGQAGIDHHFQLGQVYLMRGEPAAATEHLLRSLESGEAVTADVRNSLGAAQFALGDLAGAEEEYRAALREGEFAEVWFNLGVVYEAMGPSRTGDAVYSYRRALEINPLEGRAAANLDYLLRRGRSQPD